MQHIFAGDAVYAPPVLRAPSPSSSIGTDYGPDETSAADLEMSAEEFKNRVVYKLALNEPRAEELMAEIDPLLQRPTNPQAEKGAAPSVMSEELMASF